MASIGPEQTQIILDSVADGVFTVDRDWRVTSFNRAASEITGIPAAEAIGRPCCEVFRASICERDCALRQAIAEQRPVSNRTVYIVDAEGQRIPISISAAALRDREGNVIGGVETFRDLSEVETLRRELRQQYTFEDIISKSPAMHRIFDILPDVAASDCAVLVEGETGTGKELIARAIHNLSPRADAPFIAVNCGALPDTLLESELFGYKAGAFTHATRDKPGRFALAEDGTIFLDEIGDVSAALQVRLLRVLQEGIYEPLGATESRRANVRVLAATNRALDELVASRDFRRDLYYRINVMRLRLPPLRERRDDIPLLVEHFIERFNAVRGKQIEGVESAAMAQLLGHDWPGNVRELENAIEHAFVLCSGPLIGVRHLPEPLCPGTETGLSPAATLRQSERALIVDALRRNDWHRAAAARELGIHKSTLFRKIKALDIDLPDVDGRATPRR